MKTTHLLSGLLIAGSLTLPMTASAVGPDREAVYDSRGNYVLDFRGNCVRSNWPAGEDPCTGKSIVNARVEQPLAELSEYERNIYFEFDKATLTGEGRSKLDNIARLASADERILSADIVGHADRIGTSEYNQRLSERRAQTVRDYLAGRGFANTQVVDVAAAGEQRPLTDGCPDAPNRQQAINCLQPDRRVEVKINTSSTTAANTGYRSGYNQVPVRQ